MNETQMKRIGVLWFPAEDRHFPRYGHRVVDYQREQRDKAMSYVTDFSLAIDVGAHVGIFSRHFAKHFEKVMAFEPMENLRECMKKNVPPNVEIHSMAVSDHDGDERMVMLCTKNSGCSFLWDDPRVHRPSDVKGDELAIIRTTTIDELKLPSCGLIKVDVQGADHLVLQGATWTLRHLKPVVLIEEKPVGGPTGPVEHIAATKELMKSLGYRERELVGADRIYTP